MSCSTRRCHVVPVRRLLIETLLPPPLSPLSAPSCAVAVDAAADHVAGVRLISIRVLRFHRCWEGMTAWVLAHPENPKTAPLCVVTASAHTARRQRPVAPSHPQRSALHVPPSKCCGVADLEQTFFGEKTSTRPSAVRLAMLAAKLFVLAAAVLLSSPAEAKPWAKRPLHLPRAFTARVSATLYDDSSSASTSTRAAGAVGAGRAAARYAYSVWVDVANGLYRSTTVTGVDTFPFHLISKVAPVNRSYLIALPAASNTSSSTSSNTSNTSSNCSVYSFDGIPFDGCKSTRVHNREQEKRTTGSTPLEDKSDQGMEGGVAVSSLSHTHTHTHTHTDCVFAQMY